MHCTDAVYCYRRRKFRGLLLLLLLYMSIIMVALSHYCNRTTLQCQCHVSQAKEQSQYLSANVQREHKTCPGVNLQGNTPMGLWVCAPVCVGHTGSLAKSAEAIDMPFEGGKLAWTKEPLGCYCRHLETISSAAAM